ncbi:MAG TPA: AtpZ/AtpI family protein [Nitrospirota bacterium]
MEEKNRKFYRMLGALSTVGITLVASTVIGYFIGFYLDRAFNTSPWLTVIFFLLGVAAGFKNLFQFARRSQDSFDGEDDHKTKKDNP